MELIQSLKLLLLRSGLNGAAKVLWYPACGNDFRVLHHPATNNVSIHNDLFILSDLKSYEEEVDDILDGKDFHVMENVSLHFRDLLGVKCNFKSIMFQNEYLNIRRDCLFIWGIGNEDLFSQFKESGFDIHTLFVKRRYERFLYEDVSSTMDVLNSRFYINSFHHFGVDGDHIKEAMSFAQTAGIKLRLHTSYQGMGRYDLNPAEYVYVFEK